MVTTFDAGMIRIYTDGACAINPGPGGWAAIVVTARDFQELSGGAPMTTNNRMEIQAAIEGLTVGLALTTPASRVVVISDSEYLVHGASRWLDGWKRKGWKTKGSTPVKNQDLWQAIDQLTVGWRIEWQWVRGHSGNDYNERCDRLAREQAVLMCRGPQRDDDYDIALDTLRRMRVTGEPS